MKFEADKLVFFNRIRNTAALFVRWLMNINRRIIATFILVLFFLNPHMASACCVDTYVINNSKDLITPLGAS